MIYCIWYPSGAFGHYLNAVISVFGKDFARPKNTIKFSETGDLHRVERVLPRYSHNPTSYKLPVIDSNKNYSLLIDNGIDDESDVFKRIFPGLKYLKICYSDNTWPIVAKTSIIKAKQTSLQCELPLDSSWPQGQDWAVREKYFLYLRDHPFRHNWKPDPDCDNISLETLLDYPSLYHTLEKVGIVCDNFKDVHDQMLKSNQEYFFPVTSAGKILSALKTKQSLDLSHITDLWDQAVINYFIQIEFDLEIPANDYGNWFKNTTEIQQLL